jgi:hypothetical protein
MTTDEIREALLCDDSNIHVSKALEIVKEWFSNPDEVWCVNSNGEKLDKAKPCMMAGSMLIELIQASNGKFITITMILVTVDKILKSDDVWCCNEENNYILSSAKVACKPFSLIKRLF